MSKTTLLSILVIALVVLNLGVIGFIFLKKPPHPGKLGKRPGKIIIERLGFDDKQIRSFNALKEQHRTESKEVLEVIGATKTHLFQLLQQKDEQKRDSLIRRIGALHEQLETLHFQHFQQIKTICKPEQIDAYNAFISEMGTLIGPRHLPPPGRH